jgi:hypothetical protein
MIKWVGFLTLFIRVMGIADLIALSVIIVLFRLLAILPQLIILPHALQLFTDYRVISWLINHMQDIYCE